jgi:oxygen-independent coproporphyrinogen-3 oxidase
MMPSLVTETAAELASYAYSYPHKSSYRRLSAPVPLADAWRDEDQRRLALYVHIPFCEMRCGFCNLLTQSQPESAAVTAYLASLQRQMQVVHRQLPGAEFSQFALGGGTPTYLTAQQLETLFQHIESAFDVAPCRVSTSVEASPATCTPDRLRVLAGQGVERISLGVQSFVEADVHRIGRAQQSSLVYAALENIRTFGFPILNIDLIYGGPEQSQESWLHSLRSALRYSPEELFLYPLYVRPETGLARTGCASGHRVDLYRAGRDLLVDAGYRQISLRCFRRPQTLPANDYCCQHDGMVGLGCGARSYTRELHYATRFAVTQSGIRAILHDWMAQTDSDFAVATHGIRLNSEEQRRRFVILCLLQAGGLSDAEYAARFDSSPVTDVPELFSLMSRGWVVRRDGRSMLTEQGLENSDMAGPTLYSRPVRSRLQEFVRR